MNLVLYSYRLLIGYCAQYFSDLVLLLNDHLSKDIPQDTLFKPNDPWITKEKDTKLNTLIHLDHMGFFRSQYIGTHPSFTMALI